MTHLTPAQQAALAALLTLHSAHGDTLFTHSHLRAKLAAALCPSLPVDVVALNFVFENPPCPEGARFVECETDEGKSVNAGEWSQRPDGLWQLRVIFQRQFAQPGSVEADGWRCFHCGEYFTDPNDALEHFGFEMGDDPACKLSETDGLLVKMLRETQAELRSYRLETDAASREFYVLGAKHNTSMREEEEKGYARGLADGRALPTAPTEGE